MQFQSYIQMWSRDASQGWSTHIDRDPKAYIYKNHGIGRVSILNNWYTQNGLGNLFESRKNTFVISMEAIPVTYHRYVKDMYLNGGYHAKATITLGERTIDLLEWDSSKQYWTGEQHVACYELGFYTKIAATKTRIVDSRTNEVSDIKNIALNCASTVDRLNLCKQQKQKIEKQMKLT